MNHIEKTLSFWRDLEIFNLPDQDNAAKSFSKKQLLPWQLTFEPDKKKMWRHYVFFGKHTKENVMKCIEKAIDNPATEQDFVERPSGHTCMAAMIVDEKGYPVVNGGYLQASYLHGLWCLINKKKLNTINERLDESQQHFKERYPKNPDAENLEELHLPIVSWGHLLQEIAVLNGLKLGDLSCSETVYINSVKVLRDNVNDSLFLNSFFLDDLDGLLKRGQYAKGVQQFLTAHESLDKRTDVLTDAADFFQHIDPKNVSAGRWPSNPAYGLYAAQLGAVSTCLDSLTTQNGIIGVNGPPGTGKTTLLKDIVAEVIVDRAKRLLANRDPYFSTRRTVIKTPDFDYSFYAINEEVFRDVGIVVASNNNAAVENISKELPAVKSIDSSFKDVQYLKDFSDGLIKGDSWGVLAAALGKAKNKQDFKFNFWVDGAEKIGFGNYLLRLYRNDEGIDHCFEMKNAFEKEADELRELLSALDVFKKEASQFHQMLFPYLVDEQRKAGVEDEITALQSDLLKAEKDHEELQNSFINIQNEIDRTHKSIQFHLTGKPSLFFFQKLFKTKTFKRWNEPYLTFMGMLQAHSVAHNAIIKDKDKKHDEIVLLQQKLTEAEKEQVELIVRMDAYLKKRDKLQELYGVKDVNIPDAEIYKQFATRPAVLHKMNPWSSEKINTLRSRIFLKSLRLHELAIFSNAKFFYNNLKLFMAMLDGKAEVSEKLTTSLWKTFFFCVPVVSTSLASVSRLFGNISQESIGWLLIDEAGQATPQSIVGIMNRAKRSVIIGDPKQIKPVVTIPEKLANILNTPYSLDMTWSPLKSSAQELADRISRYGTHIENGGDSTWTGFPLRTHRRCNNPMFDIANAIAYNGQMVKAMDDEAFECVLGKSAWFDVQGTTVNNKQVVSEELDVLREKLLLLRDSPASVYVISPFKSVANECREVTKEIGAKALAGTIHTFQGKEADIVFLVLGSDPASSGSRMWASKEPNMLNVALTRAKKRFYVIGNRKLWGTMQYFDEMAGMLGANV